MFNFKTSERFELACIADRLKSILEGLLYENAVLTAAQFKRQYAVVGTVQNKSTAVPVRYFFKAIDAIRRFHTRN